MKKHLKVLLAAALLLGFAGTSYAAKIYTLPPMKWDRDAGTDSTFISIPVWGGAIVPSVAQDTTAWLDLSRFNFPDGTTSATVIPFVRFQITIGTVAPTTNDSVGYIFQFANDINDMTRTTGFIETAVAYSAVGTNAVIVDAITSAMAATSFGRFVRVIVRNAEIGSGYQRRFRVTPIIYANPD